MIQVDYVLDPRGPIQSTVSSLRLACISYVRSKVGDISYILFALILSGEMQKWELKLSGCISPPLQFSSLVSRSHSSYGHGDMSPENPINQNYENHN
jgi:hypothetical protein